MVCSVSFDTYVCSTLADKKSTSIHSWNEWFSYSRLCTFFPLERHGVTCLEKNFCFFGCNDLCETVLILKIPLLSCALAQVGAYDPDEPIWGIYATGSGYPVFSEALLERALNVLKISQL